MYSHNTHANAVLHVHQRLRQDIFTVISSTPAGMGLRQSLRRARLSLEGTADHIKTGMVRDQAERSYLPGVPLYILSQRFYRSVACASPVLATSKDNDLHQRYSIPR